MSGGSPGAGAGRPGERFPAWPVLLAAALSLWPRLALSASREIDFDGWWHVFVAGQDRWQNFFAGVWSNAHPPLFYLLLRGVMAFGRSELLFRAVSLAAGFGAGIAAAAVAWRLRRSRTMAVWTAAAFGFGFVPVALSCEVRSYMLALLFVLLSFRGFLDLLEAPETAQESRAATLFFAGAAAAIATHYFAFFYLAACVLLTALLALVHPPTKGRILRLARTRARPLAAGIAVLAIVCGLALFHARYRAERINHLASRYFAPGEAESPPAFLARNLVAEFDIFSPVEVPRGAEKPVAAGLAAALLVGVWLWVRRLSRADSAAPLMPAGFFLAILASLAAASLAGRYPFGGEMRHQSILFPFLVLSVSSLVAGWLSKIPRWAGAAGGSVLFLALAASSVRQLPRYRTYYPEDFVEADRVLDRDFSGTAVVYADQFSVVPFYSRRFDWRWSSAGRVPGHPDVLRYRVTRGREELDVLYDRARWVATFDPTPRLFETFASGLEASAADCLVVYGLAVGEPPGSVLDPANETISRAARDAGLRFGREVRLGGNRLVEVCRSRNGGGGGI